MITVPGAITSPPSEYFCFIDSESFPVGILMPNCIAKSEAASTASYKRASSPLLRQAHIQLADSDTPFSPPSKGANTILVRASAIALRLPAVGLISAVSGE